MRYLVLVLALALLAACGDTPPTPIAAVPAMQTAIAVRATFDTLFATATPAPPVDATRAALQDAWIALTLQKVSHPSAPTETAIAATETALIATMTALPTSAP